MAISDTAKEFAALHVSGNPIVCPNVYDGITAKALVDTNAKVAATASFAIAAALGLEDADLTLEQNLAAVTVIVRTLHHKLPLTVDLQDGYGSRLEEAIEKIIQLGAVGCNIEDSQPHDHALYSIESQVDRIKLIRQVAKRKGIPDFVINARTDALIVSTLEEAIKRGKAYLEAGATLVYPIQPRKALTKAEVQELVKAFDGRVNILHLPIPGTLSVKDLSKLGVSRISVGPGMMIVGIARFKEVANHLVEGGSFAV